MAEPLQAGLVGLLVTVGGIVAKVWIDHRKQRAEWKALANSAEEKERGEIWVRHKAELDHRDADLRRLREERDLARGEWQKMAQAAIDLDAAIRQLRAAAASDAMKIADLQEREAHLKELNATYRDTVAELRADQDRRQRRPGGTTSDLPGPLHIERSTTDEVERGQIPKRRR